jgi:hypothetical protein
MRNSVADYCGTIGMEEKILLPAARAARGGEALPLDSALHLDHGALAALWVMTPTEPSSGHSHNVIEEGPSGVYSQCEEMTDSDSAQILRRLQNFLPVATAKYSDNTTEIQSARSALQRAGHDLKF